MTILIENVEPPLVSVIMPVRNEARWIGKALNSLLSQTYASERTEILVIDGLSDDGTRRIIEGISQATFRADPTGPSAAMKAPPEIRIIDNPSRLVPTALNIGIGHARGDIVFRLDGHSELMPNYIEACVSKLQERRDVACVGGPSIAIGDGSVGQAYALALRSPVGVGGRTFRTLRHESYVDTLAFGAYRKELFAEVGGFDQELWRNQDIEFSARLRKAGHRLLLIQTTHTLYHAPERLQAIMRQSYRNGHWNTKVLNKMVGVLSWRHFTPGVFVLSLLSLSLAAPGFVPARYCLLILALSYALAVMIGCASIAPVRSKTAVLLPVVLCIIHTSYGLGSVLGCLEFASRLWQRWTRLPRQY
jgi:succinoglycan biosynthesis protein ExoA